MACCPSTSFPLAGPSTPMLAYLTREARFIVFQYINIQQLLWIFSVYVETIAILPQLIMLHRHQETECLSMAYVFFLGVYRLLFVLNWIHRSYYDRYFDTAGSIEHVFGAVQTVVYFIFFAVYVRIKYRDSLQKLY